MLDKIWVPEVGESCEINNCGTGWEWCEPLWIGETMCVVNHKHYKEQHYHLSSVSFRPILSETDRAIEDMMKVAPAVSMAAAHDLYLAGYRKQPDPSGDMSDPRNWREGDIIECLRDELCGCFNAGEEYIYAGVTAFGSCGVKEDSLGSKHNGWGFEKFRFSSRPNPSPQSQP